VSVRLQVLTGAAAQASEVYKSRARFLAGDGMRPVLREVGEEIVAKYRQNIDEGRFRDLTDKYKKRKAKIWGHVYPILVASGQMISAFRTTVRREGSRWTILTHAPGMHVDERGRSMKNNTLAEHHREGNEHTVARDFTKLDSGFIEAMQAKIRAFIASNSRRL
jgi:hypothetical protein